MVALEGKIILSVDVGAKNMVFCKVKSLSCEPCVEIMDWFFLNCDAGGSIPGDVQLLGRRLSALDTSVTCDVDHVLVECQTSKNIKMKVLSHCVQYHFENSVPACPVLFCSPHAKLKICDLETEGAKKFKNNYNRNKYCAVQKCTQVLQLLVDHQGAGAQQQKSFFDNSDKKDDLADSLLQVLCRLPQFKNATLTKP